jgi:hypothetical protein
LGFGFGVSGIFIAMVNVTAVAVFGKHLIWT